MDSPDGEESKELLRIMIPILRTTRKKIPCGPLQWINELSLLYGMQQRYILHSWFITSSQMSATQPLIVLLVSRKFKNSENSSNLGDIESEEVI